MDVLEAVRDVLLEDGAITALVDQRIYPVELPDAPTYPAVVLTKAAGQGEYDMAGDVGLERARIQADCYALTQAECNDLRLAVRRRLSGFSGGAASAPCQIQSAFCINDFDLTEPATERAGPRLRRRTLEFQIWNTEV